ncbi:hypothetical protein C7293_31535 [filamentous cyanobacterium CCT1]|nr:hypothetical protein C7293_31535 [filamentous cyanobacterium CCT1]
MGGDRVALATIKQNLDQGSLELAPGSPLEGDPLLPNPAESDPFGDSFNPEGLDPSNPFDLPLDPESPGSESPEPAAPLGDGG